MKHKLAVFLLLPLTVLSCGTKDNGFAAVKNLVDGINKSSEHPTYRVIGSLDFNDWITPCDAEFINSPNGNKFVPYVRYTEGFYTKYADTLKEDQTIIFAMASHSYWLRAPLKIDKENFYVLDEKGKENKSCANYVLTHFITAWIDAQGSSNPSSCYTYYETLADGGFAIGGNKVHTVLRIDNYPSYPSEDSEFVWKERNPLPAYNNTADGKFNIRFEYDKNGWLKREYFASINYDYHTSSVTQLAGESRYFYQGESGQW